MTWWEWGPSNGRPVLWCTGAAMSGRLGFGFEAVSTLGLRLIGLNRPGIGDSSPHPEKTLESWVDDVAHLTEHGGWDDPLAVGFSQGAPFAFTLAGAGLTSAVAIVSGQDDLINMTHLLTREVAELVKLAAEAPEDLMAQVARDVTAESFIEMVDAMNGPADRRLYNSEPFRSVYTQAVHEAFRQGADGYALDLVNALGPWPTPPEEIPNPVTLWYGGQDTSPVHSPDHGLTLASRLPNAGRFLLKEEGGSLLWTRGDQILRHLASLSARPLR